MAIQLNKKQIKSIKDLEQNFSKKVEVYRLLKEKELSEKKRTELKEELKNLENYYRGCQNSEISDLQTNIQFCGAKIEILKKILEK